MRLEYTVVLTPCKGGGHVVEVPALPGCVTCGETLLGALLMAEDAMTGYLEMLRDDGDPIPEEGDEIVVDMKGRQEAYLRKVAVVLPNS